VRHQYDRPWGATPRQSQLVVIAEHADVNEQAIRAVLGA
jgi:cobalamin biosynthesis protein CobW